ncbi:MAG: hypothetical protein ACRC28_02785 [Clostridium sp.]|uniref:hypothetical protein n=1 Tax=Clostridium sp. TaxID=1506 RepID=UPI003F3915BC
MKKKNKIIVGCSIGLLILLTVVTRVFLKSEYRITIQNNANEVVKDLELVYAKGDKIDNISVNSYESIDYYHNTEDVEGENVVLLRYKDNNGQVHETIVIGYLEKGYSGHVRVAIHNVDKDKKLDLDVEIIY